MSTKPTKTQIEINRLLALADHHQHKSIRYLPLTQKLNFGLNFFAVTAIMNILLNNLSVSLAMITGSGITFTAFVVVAGYNTHHLRRASKTLDQAGDLITQQTTPKENPHE